MSKKNFMVMNIREEISSSEVLCVDPRKCWYVIHFSDGRLGS